MRNFGLQLRLITTGRTKTMGFRIRIGSLKALKNTVPNQDKHKIYIFI